MTCFFARAGESGDVTLSPEDTPQWVIDGYREAGCEVMDVECLDAYLWSNRILILPEGMESVPSDWLAGPMGPFPQLTILPTSSPNENPSMMPTPASSTSTPSAISPSALPTPSSINHRTSTTTPKITILSQFGNETIAREDVSSSSSADITFRSNFTIQIGVFFVLFCLMCGCGALWNFTVVNVTQTALPEGSQASDSGETFEDNLSSLEKQKVISGPFYE